MSPEDTILAKLDWLRQVGGVGEQQRRDMLSVISVLGKLGVLQELKKYLQ